MNSDQNPSLQNPGLLEKAKESVAAAVSRVAHSELAETVTATAHQALEKLEQIAPKVVAGPVHALVEATAQKAPEVPKASAPPPVAEARPQRTTRIFAPPAKQAKRVVPAVSMTATPTFKVKRGQKH